ncbi:MAG: glycyl radical protein [Desulfarculaceae bacterium]|jgi:formate C-acetyltransferase
MELNQRVAELRQQSLDTSPEISAERALLLTRFYQKAREDSAPLLRAQAFAYLLQNLSVYINGGELIVGERGPAPKATSTYPEICCHSLEDLEALHSRARTSYQVSPEVRQAYEQEIIPFWKGKTIRERIFAKMTPEWLAAYEAGVFTEFMEQRAPGHTVLDGKIYAKGMNDFIADIDARLAALDFGGDTQAHDREQELKAMRICAQALIDFSGRYADKARELARQEKDPVRRTELESIAEVCTQVPAQAPRNFWEALQYYWFVHLGVIIELNPWDAFNPGRLDQHLMPFYEKGLASGELTPEWARELLQCFWVKFNNQPAPPKVGVTAAESSTYTDFANINSGGLKTDGSDGVNPVTYLVLDVIDQMRLVQPSSNIQLSRKSPDRFLKKALEIVRKGWGQPSIFNADLVVEEMLRQGKSQEDARQGGTSGCVETGAFGKEAYFLTGYFNLPKVLELTLHNGRDPRTGKQVGLDTGPQDWQTFADLMKAFEGQLKHLIDIKIRGNRVIEKLFAKQLPAPFLSLLIDDCIAKGQDYLAGGARYNTSYIQGVGIGTVSDCLSALKHQVFEGDVSLSELISALAADFGGKEKLRQRLLNWTPRYGNDDDRADAIMQEVFKIFHDSVNGRPTHRDGVHRINMLPTTSHIYFGSVTGATPDGRRAGEPLSEGISPVQGADRQGPTAVLKSASKMDQVLTGGTLLNQKFTPQLLEGNRGLENLAALVRTYFKLGGHHIQFNVVRADTLRQAQAEPEKYRDLIVRVAGYSDYFCDLSQVLQDEIIARTEHQASP